MKKLFGLNTKEKINNFMHELDEKRKQEIKFVVDTIYINEMRKVVCILNRLECQCLMVKSDFVNIKDLYELISELFMNPMLILYFLIANNNTTNVTPVYTNIRTLYSEMYCIKQKLLLDEATYNKTNVKKSEIKHKHV